MYKLYIYIYIECSVSWDSKNEMYDSKYKIAQCVENKGEQAEQTYKLTFPAKLKIHDIKRLDKQKLKCPTPTPHLIC